MGVASKKGFVNKTGNKNIMIKYDDAFSFVNGLARVRQNEKWF